METITKVKSKVITSTKLAIVTLVALTAGGVAFMAAPPISDDLGNVTDAINSPIYYATCVLKQPVKNNPNYKAGDDGSYYLKTNLGKVSGIDEALLKCSRLVYEPLMIKHCELSQSKDWVEPMHYFVNLYNEDFELIEAIPDDSGIDPHDCYSEYYEDEDRPKEEEEPVVSENEWPLNSSTPYLGSCIIRNKYIPDWGLPNYNDLNIGNSKVTSSGNGIGYVMEGMGMVQGAIHINKLCDLYTYKQLMNIYCQNGGTEPVTRQFALHDKTGTQVQFGYDNNWGGQFTCIKASVGKLTVVKDAGLLDSQVLVGSSGVKVAQYKITASAHEDISIQELKMNLGGLILSTDISNLTVKQGATVLGQFPVVSKDNNRLFNLNLIVKKNQSITISLYADIKNSAGVGSTLNFKIPKFGITGLGVSSNMTVKAPKNVVKGQTITIAKLASVGKLNVMIDANTPASANLAMGSTGVELAKFVFKSDNVEDIKVTEWALINTFSSSTHSSYKNIKLYDGTKQIGNTVNPSNISYDQAKVSFSGLNLIVPKGSQKVITVKADVKTYNDGATPESQLLFLLSQKLGYINAVGVSSNSQIMPIIGSIPASNNMTIAKLVTSAKKYYFACMTKWILSSPTSTMPAFSPSPEVTSEYYKINGGYKMIGEKDVFSISGCNATGMGTSLEYCKKVNNSIGYNMPYKDFALLYDSPSSTQPVKVIEYEPFFQAYYCK